MFGLTSLACIPSGAPLGSMCGLHVPEEPPSGLPIARYYSQTNLTSLAHTSSFLIHVCGPVPSLFDSLICAANYL